VNNSYGRLAGHTGCVSSVTWHDETELISGSWDHTIKLWNTDTLSMVSSQNMSTSVFSTAYSPRHRVVLSTHVDSKVKTWDPRGGEGTLGTVFTSHKGIVSQVKWHPTRDNYFLTAGHDKTVKVWDFRSKYPLYTVKEHTEKVFSVAWSVEGNETTQADLMSGGADTQLRQHHMEIGRS